MGVAYEGFCYKDAVSAQMAIASDYHHEHNPAYTFYSGSISGNDLVIHHYKVQSGNVVLDTAIPGYTLPTCLVEGSLTGDTFNPSNLNPVDVVNAVASGFIIIALPLSVAWAGRRFLQAIFHH